MAAVCTAPAATSLTPEFASTPLPARIYRADYDIGVKWSKCIFHKVRVSILVHVFSDLVLSRCILYKQGSQMKAWWVWLYCDVWLSRDMQWGLGSWISLPWYWLEISSDIPAAARWATTVMTTRPQCVSGRCSHLHITTPGCPVPATRKYLSQKYHPSRKKITRLSKIFPIRRNPQPIFWFWAKIFLLKMLV